MSLIFGALLLLLLGGCASDDINVAQVAMTDRPDAAVVGWTATEGGRFVFSPEDEEVTVKVLFSFNYRGVYEWYNIKWIAPNGEAYKVVSTRTDFGSHRDLKASMKIRGKMASRLPGVWRVQIDLQGRDGAPDRELVSRLFRIDEPTSGMIAAGLTPVDAALGDKQRSLASYASVPKAAAKPTAINGTIKTPASKDKTTSAKRSESMTMQGAPGVLPPLAIVGSGPVKQRTTPVPGATAPPAESEISVVTLQSTPSDPSKPVLVPRQREYPGCPPLYYHPGPDCVEQAPEE